jgi:hypothetical protein
VVADGFGTEVIEYGAWRAGLAEALSTYAGWLENSGHAELSARLTPRLRALVARLSDERISIAVVAEFSRGKSELINALFFSRYGRRVLPSGAGRTTMCPTELLYDASRPPSIRLLPIESRLREVPLFELRQRSDDWNEIPIEPGDRDSVARALDSVRATLVVSADEADALGLSDRVPGTGTPPDGVEIPRWRHAIVNFPDPLLARGLVVIDTPGLNAIGSEPELTLATIPNAEAVLFVLAADTGVTASDLEVWRKHVASTQRSGRLVVLNKIDGLWDELREPSEIHEEIRLQVESVAQALGVAPAAVFPVSAQKALVARVRGDEALYARSRLGDLERALAVEIVPRQRRLLAERILRDFEDIHAIVRGVLDARAAGMSSQIEELEALRGRKRSVVHRLAVRLKNERAAFDASVTHLQTVRSLLARHIQSIQSAIGLDALKAHVRDARESMHASRFSTGLSDSMTRLLEEARADFGRVRAETAEVQALIRSVQTTFSDEHGLILEPPASFPMARFDDEMAKIEALHRERFGPASLVTTEKWALTRRFFDSVAAHLKALYLLAGSEIGNWGRELLLPVETRIGERQRLLVQRFESLRRVGEAVESLEVRIGELSADQGSVEREIAATTELASVVEARLALAIAESPDRQTDSGRRNRSGHAAGDVRQAVSAEVGTPLANGLGLGV